MNEIELNLKKDKKYVVACSFGPDSMALLSSAIERGYKIVVAHVNYRKRDSALFEQKSLEKYCYENNIKIYVLDLLGVRHSGNFQEWAREKRYKFFREVAKKERADAVLVAHQQDDVIETFIMQERRGNVTKNPGIPVENELFGIKIIRPLLHYSKQELREYDDFNKVPYSIDESNLSDAYFRNKIRHEIVEKLTENERKEILEKIKAKQPTKIQFKTMWSVDEFDKLSYEQIVRLLDHYMQKTNTHRDISAKFVGEIKKAFSSNTNTHFDLTEGLIIEKDYSEVYLVNKNRLSGYEFKFDRKLTNHIFDIDFSEGAEDRRIQKNIKKLIIKNLNKSENVIIKDYKSSVNRLFIDWKMPHYLREVWPGIYNEENELLYIPRYQKEYTEKHKSKFVIKTKYFTEF